MIDRRSSFHSAWSRLLIYKKKLVFEAAVYVLKSCNHVANGDDPS